MDRDPVPGSPGHNMAIVAHLAYLIRYVDFADTLFFILRKKFDNVSTLQESIHNTDMSNKTKARLRDPRRRIFHTTYSVTFQVVH